jgi:hypothetical protein
MKLTSSHSSSDWCVEHHMMLMPLAYDMANLASI